MVRFHELFGGTFEDSNIKRLSNLGAVSFGKGVTDKNEERTPHYEIKKSIEMYENIPLINSAFDELIRFLIPNREIKIASSDKKSKAIVEDWYKQRRGSKEEVKNILKTNLMCGNAPVERHYAKTTNGKPVLDNIFSMNDMTRIYINPDDIGGDSAFIFELPIGIKTFKYMGEWQTPTYFPVRYIKNYSWFMKRIYGIKIPAWKMEIYRTGWSRDNLYGRSPLASAIDVANIYTEIISSWDTIAKTRQIDKKILTVGDNETGIDVDQDKMDELQEQLEDAKGSYLLFNVPLKLLQQDIATSGKYDLMEGVFDIVRRLLMTSLLPQHLTPWSDTATTQGVETSMPSFLGRIKAKQNEFIDFLNGLVIDDLRRTYPWIAEDTTHIFDEPKILPDAHYTTQVMNLIQAGIITPQEGRKYLLEIGIINEDILIENKESVKSKEDFKGVSYPDIHITVDKDEKNVILTYDVWYNSKIYSFNTLSQARDFVRKNIKESSNNSESYKEVAQQANVSFSTWKKRGDEKKLFQEPIVDEVYYRNVGGKDVRVVETKTMYHLYEGLVLKQSFDKDVYTKGLVKQNFDSYVDYLLKKQEEFTNQDSEEDIIIKELEDTFEKEVKQNIEDVFNAITQFGRKREKFSEDFLSSKILPKLDDIFSGFNARINSLVSKSLNKLGISVINDDSDSSLTTLDKKDVDDLKVKRDLMKTSLKTQLQQTKDKMLADMKTSIIQGISSGKDVKNIRAEVESNFNYDDGVGWKFKRIIQNETRNSAEILKLRKMQKLGFETFEWNTREDEKVRDTHKMRNRRVYNIQDALDGKIKRCGEEYNCRCRSSPYS